MKNYPLLTIGLFLALCSCHHNIHPDREKSTAEVIQYAEYLSILECDGYHKIRIFSPWSESDVLFSAVLTGENNTFEPAAGEKLIQIPVDNIACFSSTQWAAAIKLGCINSIGGITEMDFVHNRLLQEKIDSGHMVDLGRNGQIYTEALINLAPGAVLFAPSQEGTSFELENTSLNLIPYPDFYEQSPLGRAEWIKLIALLTGTFDTANQIFSKIRNNYSGLVETISHTVNRPTVFSDKFFQGQWFVPGGKSYAARMLHDAGAKYLWHENENTASFPLDFEFVFSKAAEADFWRITYYSHQDLTYESLLSENELYGHFNAWKQKQVIICNTLKTAYFEDGVFEPDVQLKDLVLIFHPEHVPGHQPKYYHLMRQ